MPWAQSALPVATTAVRLTDLKPEQCNAPIPPRTRARILELRNDLEAGPSYNTFNDILHICRRAKTLQAQGSQEPFAQSFAMGPAPLEFRPQEPYRGGNCFASAEILKGQIEQHLQLKAYVVGYYAGPNTLVQWPSLTHDGEEENQQLLEKLQWLNHADVAVPQRHRGGGPLHVLHIMCGLGSSPNHWQELRAGVDDARIATLRLLPRPDVLRWQAIEGSHRFYISDPTCGRIFGVKLLEGEAFISHRAAETLAAGRGTRPHVPVNADGEIIRSFNFGALCRWQALLDTDDEEEVAGLAREWHNCRIFLDVVAELFGQPTQFAAEVEQLLVHHQDILRQIVLEPAATMSFCLPALREALDVSGPLESLISQWHLDTTGPALWRARSAMEEAAQKVRSGQKFSARMAYSDAKEAYIKAVEETAVAVEAVCAHSGDQLPPLDPQGVGRMPEQLYRAIGRGLLVADPSQGVYWRLVGPVKAACKRQIESELNILPPAAA
jgi:hypothetical protein